MCDAGLRGKYRLADSPRARFIVPLQERPATVGGPYMCDNLVLHWMTETRQT
jgi:hypothetical protein